MVAHPLPSRPCRGQPIRKPIAIGTSSASSLPRNPASLAIFSSRLLVSATEADVWTSSFSLTLGNFSGLIRRGKQLGANGESANSLASEREERVGHGRRDRWHSRL